MAPTLRDVLKSATADHHSRIDAAVSDLDLATADGYGRFLQMHAAVLPALEDWLDATGVVNELPDWPQRRRKAALYGDIARLGLARPASPGATTPFDVLSFDNVAPARIGILYVLEGSRLGVSVLAARSGCATANSRMFLTHGQGLPLWRTFVGWLNGHTLSAAERDVAVAAARRVFDAYGDAIARCTLPA